MENENQNWIVNHIWDDADGNPTQWIFNNNDDFPYYIDYIEAVNQYEVSHKFRRLYSSKDFESCVNYIRGLWYDI